MPPKFNFAAMMAKAGAGDTEATPSAVPAPTTSTAAAAENRQAETTRVGESTPPEAAQPPPAEPPKKKRKLVKLGAKAAGKKKTRPQLIELINDGSSGSEGELEDVSPYAQGWVEELGNPTVKDNRVAALISREISLPADMDGLRGRTHNSLALQVQEQVLSVSILHLFVTNFLFD